MKNVGMRVITEEDFNFALELFEEWKNLDSKVRTFSKTRGITMPSEITETIACYLYNLNIKVVGIGDAIDVNTNEIYEIKGSSSIGPNSFSPSEIYDNLIYIKLDNKRETFFLYKTNFNSEDVGKIKVNKNQTVSDQQKEGRRPRFSIQKEIIERYNLKPDFEVCVKTKSVRMNKNA